MTNPTMIDTNNPITSGAIMVLAVVVLIAVLSWMRDRDSEPQSPQCPPARYGQQLIGRGHMESDGQPGELQCVYSTAPVYNRLMAEK